jgi:ATP/maltotriose-dependent transcriptional regulator MalT
LVATPRAARDAFEALLAAHPDYCSGLTIENDLAVMLHAQGELASAEDLARRSLASWRGVPHTEALSLLVLGAVLTSAGRHDEADTVLGQALMLGREQKSALFEAEALVRRARLRQQCGRWVEGAGRPGGCRIATARQQRSPARVAVRSVARGRRCGAGRQDRARHWLIALRAISLRSVHPLLHARLARVEGWLALQNHASRSERMMRRYAVPVSPARLACWNPGPRPCC